MRKSPEIKEVIKKWLELYESEMTCFPKPLHDQPAFRKAVYESGVRFLILPDEFNLRVSFPHMIPGNVKVKMLHGRHEKLEAAIEETSRVEFLPRVYGGIYRKWELFELIKNNILKRIPILNKRKWTSSIHKD